jgi:hypothetical protein
MNDHFSKTCLALIVGLLAAIAFRPREKKATTKALPLSRPVPGPGGNMRP